MHIEDYIKAEQNMKAQRALEKEIANLKMIEETVKGSLPKAELCFYDHNGHEKYSERVNFGNYKLIKNQVLYEVTKLRIELRQLQIRFEAI